MQATRAVLMLGGGRVGGEFAAQFALPLEGFNPQCISARKRHLIIAERDGRMPKRALRQARPERSAADETTIMLHAVAGMHIWFLFNSCDRWVAAAGQLCHRIHRRTLFAGPRGHSRMTHDMLR